MLLVFAGLPSPAAAETSVDVTDMRLERSDDGVFLSAHVDFDLPAIVEAAMLKGIAVHFVTEAEISRERWYWYDRKVAAAARYARLAYQPLTRRWRLNVSPEPIGSTGLGLTLGQSFDSLQEALASVQRIARWRIGEPGDVEPGSTNRVQLRFRLDTSQLPRPIQIGVAGQPDWSLGTTRNERLVAEAAR